MVKPIVAKLKMVKIIMNKINMAKTKMNEIIMAKIKMVISTIVIIFFKLTIDKIIMARIKNE
jgi:hypothetical protein